MARVIWVVLLAGIAFLHGVGSAGAEESRATPAATPLPGTELVVYMTITNNGCTPDRLLSARTPIAENVLAYRSRDDSDLTQIEPLPEGIDIPAGGTLELRDSGSFLIVRGLSQALKAGDTFVLTLTFTFSIDADVVVTVRDPARPDTENAPTAPTTVDTMKISEVWAEYRTLPSLEEG